MPSTAVSCWKHARPKKYYTTARNLFGPPTVLANVPHGLAVWRRHGNSLFNEHVLKDEDVRHCVPAPHHDFFYTSVKYYVPPQKRADVLRLSGSIQYDGLTKRLTARCGGLGANIATLYLGMCVAMGDMSIQQVKRGHLYVKHIRGEALGHEAMRHRMVELKRRNHKRYARELTLTRDPYAFAAC